MELIFKADTHKYTSDDNIDKPWLSTTGIISLFKPPFDKVAISTKASKNKRSKWYGHSPEAIMKIWEEETNRALSLGSWYHDQREAEVIACDTLRRDGIDLPIFRPILDGELKKAPAQSITPGIYPEHMVYLKSARICGQADRVEVVENRVDIYDYKTNKEIKTEAFTNWEGITSKLTGPLSHIDDCNLFHYALQLSIYMYIILKHNHSLKPGKLQIHHIKFEIEEKNEFGYPTIAKDPMGDPIINEVIPYDLPYLKKEVNQIIKYLKTHPEVYTKKK
jgi:hypothetical protein